MFDRYNPWENRYPESRFGNEPSAIDLRTKLPEPVKRTIASQTQSSDESRLVPDNQRGVQEVSLIINELGFFPRTFFVTQNIPVRLFVTSATKKKSLCVMIDEFNVRKSVSLDEIEEITFMPKASGQYRLHCPVNNLEGTMVVREIASE